MTNKQKRRMARFALRDWKTPILLRGRMTLYSHFRDKFWSALWKWKKS